MYPAVKHFPLNLAATIFLGAGIGAERTDITRAFLEMVKAVVAPIRTPLPGTQMRRGVRVGEYVVSYLIDQIPIRRDRGGDDLFSPLCRATTDDGALLSPRAVADHMNFLLVAAHDTVTSALTAFIWMMAANPDWQHRLRGEVAALGPHDDPLLRYDQLESMPLTEQAYKESLRLVPPVAAVRRRTLCKFTFQGFPIPAGAPVVVHPLFTHYMPGIWPDPERFDPMRFTAAAETDRGRFAFVPFGGGADRDLGLHYALIQAKCFARHFLARRSVSVPRGYTPAWRPWPVPHPKDGLQVMLSPV